MDDSEVIAVLLSGYDDDTGRFRSTVVLRDCHGHVSLRDIAPDDAAKRGAGAARDA